MNIKRHVSIRIDKPKKDQEFLEDRTPDATSKDESTPGVTIINKAPIPHEVGFAIAISVVATTVVGLTLASALTFNYIDNHKAATS